MNANSILKTYNNQLITPLDDAMHYLAAIPWDGVLHGVGLSLSGTNGISYGSGRGMIQGREFQILSHTATYTLPASGTYKCLIIVKMDLSNTDEPLILDVKRGTASEYPSLTQTANVNLVNGVWEMELGRVTLSSSGFSNLSRTVTNLVTYAANQDTRLKNAIRGLSVSGRVITYTRDDGSTGTITTQDTTYSVMSGASSSSAGASGLVPAPSAGDTDRFLAATGQWARIPSMTGATSSAAGKSGAVPAPSAGSIYRFLRADGSWAAPPTMTGASTSAAGSAGYVPKPSSGAVTRVLRADGTWAEVATMQGASTSADGAKGLVPAPAAGNINRYLRADGSWVVTNTMTGATTSAAGSAGAVPAPAAGSIYRFLRADGSWATPPNASTSAAGYMTAADKTKMNAMCYVKMYDVGVSKTCTANANTVVFNNQDPAVWIGSGNTLVGAIFCWTNGSVLYPTNQTVNSNGLYSLTLFNPQSSDRTINTVRLLLFYK